MQSNDSQLQCVGNSRNDGAAKQSGVAAEKIPAALAGGFADSRPLQIVGPEMATETFDPIKWRVKTLLKDLSIAIDLSTKQGNAIPMSGLAAN